VRGKGKFEFWNKAFGKPFGKKRSNNKVLTEYLHHDLALLEVPAEHYASVSYLHMVYT
jgi:hypothetical protein